MTQSTIDTPTQASIPLGKAPFEPQPTQVWRHRTSHRQVQIIAVTDIGRYPTVVARRLDTDRLTDPSLESFMLNYWPEER
jgi:hypothetical protein